MTWYSEQKGSDGLVHYIKAWVYVEFGVAVIKLLSTWGSNCSSRASQALLLSCNVCLSCFVIWLLLPQTPRICILSYSTKTHISNLGLSVWISKQFCRYIFVLYLHQNHRKTIKYTKFLCIIIKSFIGWKFSLNGWMLLWTAIQTVLYVVPD